MQNRKNEFTLEPINNIMQGSTFGSSSIIPVPPEELNQFLLMNEQPFKLMNGQNFLLANL